MDNYSFVQLITTLDGGKRLDAHFTEQWFQEKLIRRSYKDLDDTNMSFGWIRVKRLVIKGEEFYDWLLFVPDFNIADAPPQAFLKFSKMLKNTEHRVFVVTCIMPLSVAEALDQESKMEFNVFIYDHSSEELKPNQSFGRQLTQTIHNNKPKCCTGEPIDAYQVILMNNFTDKDKAHLFFNRCIMNYGPDRFPCDIDALVFALHGPIIFEFKRKTPAKCGLAVRGYPLTEESAGRLYFDILKKLKNISNGQIRDSAGKLDYSKIFEQVARQTGCTQLGLSHEYSGGFSLDYNSHVKTVFFADKFGIRYCYVIWRRESSSLAGLFTEDLELKDKDNQDIRISRMKPELFQAVTVTYFEDNGDVHANDKRSKSNGRVQFLVNERDFRDRPVVVCNS